ncbi:hypothetical protein [Dyadobacter sp. CY326]|uniref:hypothetical protein n=1 Tax=Dyadobacter sp. CY326 TaxID=2907300 RepID=UPI001F1FC10E|nr:hypothetical protein [Dyadobacter sp. CY326]MCE7066681.1 hypothetical protein [Dyadobacter sp. CY326]
MSKVIPFNFLKTSDLIKGATYEGGIASNLSSEPISKLLPVGNQAGIRFIGTVATPRLVVLYTTLNDRDWPDELTSDKVIYFGDNKSPGKEIHDTIGNQVLRSIFHSFYLRKSYPPILLFSKGFKGFDRIFRGILAPGYEGLNEMEDLIAVWRTKEGERFQNYRAVFNILPVEIVERDTLESIIM